MKKFILFFFCLIFFDQQLFSNNHEIDSLEKALSVTKNPRDRFSILMALGNELINVDKKKTHRLIDESMGIARKTKDDKMIAQVLLLKGRVAETEGRNKEALTLFIESNRYFEKIKDDRGIGQTLNNIGIIHWYNKDYEKAIDYFNQAYAAHARSGDKYGMSTNRVNIAIIYDEQGKFEEALKIYEEALKIFIELEDDWSVAACYNNIGLNYTSTGQFDKADIAYQKSLSLYRELNDHSGLASGLNNIGYNLLKNKKFGEAIPYLTESLRISEEEEYLYDMKLALLNLANSYYGLGKYKDAFEYHKKYSTIKDSILDTESKKSMLEMETKFSSEKKNMEIKNLKKTQELEKMRQEEKDAKTAAERETRNTIQFSIIGIVLVTAGLFYWRYAQKKKDNVILQSKNDEILIQKSIIEEKNKDITDSIQYAKTIQDSVLPDERDLKNYFSDSFVLFMPRDIVSGDFYWYTSIDDKIIFTVGDCTGHGVPGSLMSMMGINLLHQIVREKKITDPAEILTELDKLLAMRFAKESMDMQSKDGMDIAIGLVEREKNLFSYASAMRPVYFCHNGELMELKNDIFPIGGSYREKIFKTREVELKAGDSIYFTSDGYADQFGGEKGKKFLTKRLKAQIQDHSLQPMNQQKEKLHQEFIAWKGKNEQVDDVCIIGVKI